MISCSTFVSLKIVYRGNASINSYSVKETKFPSDVKMTSHGPPRWYEITACLVLMRMFSKCFYLKILISKVCEMIQIINYIWTYLKFKIWCLCGRITNLTISIFMRYNMIINKWSIAFSNKMSSSFQQFESQTKGWDLRKRL